MMASVVGSRRSTWYFESAGQLRPYRMKPFACKNRPISSRGDAFGPTGETLEKQLFAAKPTDELFWSARSHLG